MRKFVLAAGLPVVICVFIWILWLVKLQMAFGAKQEEFAKRTEYARQTIQLQFHSSPPLDQSQTYCREGNPGWKPGDSEPESERFYTLFIKNPGYTQTLAQQDFQANLVATNKITQMRNLGFHKVIISNGSAKWVFPLN